MFIFFTPPTESMLLWRKTDLSLSFWCLCIFHSAVWVQARCPSSFPTRLQASFGVSKLAPLNKATNLAEFQSFSKLKVAERRLGMMFQKTFTMIPIASPKQWTWYNGLLGHFQGNDRTNVGCLVNAPFTGASYWTWGCLWKPWRGDLILIAAAGAPRPPDSVALNQGDVCWKSTRYIA